MNKKYGILFFALGLLLLLLAGFLFLQLREEDQTAGVQSRQILQKLRVLQQTEAPTSPAIPTDPEKQSTLILDGDAYLGILSIPSLELELPVMDSWSYEKLKSAPCRQAGSIGGDGLVICAHNYSSHFGALHTLEPGTLILMTDAAGQKHSYILSHVATVSAEDTDAVLDSDFSLVLYTCTPGGRNRIAAYCIREN